jgi:hypothetical protein
VKVTALFFAAAGVLFGTVVVAQQPVLRLTATSVNVNEPGNSVSIDLNRWSTDQERNQLVTALTPPAPAPVAAPAPAPAAVPAPPTAEAPPAGAEGAEVAATRGGRGGARGGGGGARGGGGGARGGGARGGRGGNAGPTDPIGAFTAAIGRAPTIGFIWTNEITGYAIKHAVRFSASDRSEHIILATNRRLGANTSSWTPVKGTPTAYEFTLIEIRFPSSGTGEAKTSLTANIAVDNETKTIGLENYVAATALFANVRRP